MKLNHIAIIPDGNRRWAKAHRLPTFKGHEKGMANVEYILREARRMNIPYVTAWGCSRDNVTKRSISEIRFLYNIFEKNFNKMLTDKEICPPQIKRLSKSRPRLSVPRRNCALGGIGEPSGVSPSENCLSGSYGATMDAPRLTTLISKTSAVPASASLSRRKRRSASCA